MRSNDRSRSSRGRDRRSDLAGRRTASYDVCSFVNVGHGRNCRTNRDTAPSTLPPRCAIAQRVIRTRCCVRLRIRTVRRYGSVRCKEQMKYSCPIRKRLAAVIRACRTHVSTPTSCGGPGSLSGDGPLHRLGVCLENSVTFPIDELHHSTVDTVVLVRRILVPVITGDHAARPDLRF